MALKQISSPKRLLRTPRKVLPVLITVLKALNAGKSRPNELKLGFLTPQQLPLLIPAAVPASPQGKKVLKLSMGHWIFEASKN